uniref:Ig-like domain-containing protein n=1 Tax=Amphiprion percula TaxID=161767 RepID=A0A3P8SUU0_AMPPE
MKTVMWFGLVLVAVSTGKVIFTEVGQKATIECGISSYTKQLEWSRENQQIIRIGKRGFPTKGTAEIVQRSRMRPEPNLEIYPVKDTDTGKFTCKADATVQEHMLLVVSVSVVPSGALQVGSEATLYCQVKDPNLGVTVEWKKPDGTLLKGSSTFDLKPVADSDAGPWNCTLTYEGETFSQTLMIKVSGPTPTTTTPYDPQKDIHKPAGRNHTTEHKSGDAELLLLGLDWWVWLAVGVGCLIVILLTVFVIVLCKRNRERKKKFQRMKSTEQPLKPKKYCQCDRQAAAAKPQQGRRREKPSALPLQAC